MELPVSKKPDSIADEVPIGSDKNFRAIARGAISLFVNRSCGLLAGAVAFFSILSIVPVLFIAISLADLGPTKGAAQSTLSIELSRWIGPTGAATLFDVLSRAGAQGSTTTRILHPLVLVYMSTRLFSQLRRSINHVWRIEMLPSKGVKDTLTKKLRRFVTSFLVVVVIEALVLGVVGVKTSLAMMTARFPSFDVPIMWRILEVGLSFLVVLVLFAAMFRLLPDGRIAWRDLFVGAFVTAFLFSAGTKLVSFYVGHKAMDDAFGDGGAIVMLLVWMSYSAQIFFFGVAFTAVWAHRRGDGIQAVHGARVMAAAAH